MMGNPKQQITVQPFKFEVTLLGGMHDMGGENALTINKSLLGDCTCDNVHLWDLKVKPVKTFLAYGKQRAVFQRFQSLVTGCLRKEAQVTTCKMMSFE